MFKKTFQIMIFVTLILGLTVLSGAIDKPKVNSINSQGVVSGFDCAVYRILCPSTHRGFDMATTGILTDKGDWYFVVNVPPSFLNQYYLERLDVSGDTYSPYDHAIEPKKIFLVKDKEKTLIFEKGQFIDSEGHRSTFVTGKFDGEKWLCSKCEKGN